MHMGVGGQQGGRPGGKEVADTQHTGFTMYGKFKDRVYHRLWAAQWGWLLWKLLWAGKAHVAFGGDCSYWGRNPSVRV